PGKLPVHLKRRSKRICSAVASGCCPVASGKGLASAASGASRRPSATAASEARLPSEQPAANRTDVKNPAGEPTVVRIEGGVGGNVSDPGRRRRTHGRGRLGA